MLPLHGIRVVDASRLLAGPYCAMLLADMGADVIKVEPPGGEDGRFFTGEAEGDPFFVSVNRNKRSLTLNLQAPEGRELFHRLLRMADVLVENFLPAFSTKHGLDPEQTARINPSLIHCSVTGFGRTGPYADRPGTDVIFQGMSGLMRITGTADDPPIKVGAPLGDMVAGLIAAYGVALALLQRRKEGGGPRVEVSVLEGLLALQTPLLALYRAEGVQPPRLGSGNPFNAPVQMFATQDDYITVSAFNDKFWRRLIPALEVPDLLADPRFATNRLRLQHRAELIRLLSPRFLLYTTAEWLDRLIAAGVPCGPVYDYPALLADPHLQIRELFHRLSRPGEPDLTSLRGPVWLDGHTGVWQRPPPALGEHTEEILAEIGVGPPELEILRTGNVV